MSEVNNNVWKETWTACGDAGKSMAHSANKMAAKTVEATALSGDVLMHGGYVLMDGACIELRELKGWMSKDGEEFVESCKSLADDFFGDDDADVVIADAVTA